MSNPADHETEQSEPAGPHWGGFLHDNIDETKVLRVTSQNKNGFSTNYLQADFESLHHHRHAIKSGINMIQESNLNWRRHETRELFTQTGRKAHNNFTATTVCSNLPTKSRWQPGGAVIYSVGAVQNRLISQGKDPTGMGRWCYQTFKGTDDIKVAFISAYRVCNQSIQQVGEFTSYRHQYLYYRSKGHPTPNPRYQFLRELQSVILDFMFQGYDICLGIDANEEIEDQKQQLRNFAGECGLISVHETIFDEDYYQEFGIPYTYNRSKRKIDYIMCSPRLLDCVKTAAVLAENIGVVSDHRCLVVDFDAQQVFGGTLNTTVRPNDRILRSHDPKGNSTYRHLLHNLLLQGNVYNRVKKLKSRSDTSTFTNNMHNEAEALDLYITRCMRKAENRSAWRRQTNFSPRKLAAGKQVHFWKIALSAIKNNKTIPTEAMKIIVRDYLQSDILIPTTKEEIEEELKLAQTAYKKVEQNAKEIRLEFLQQQAEMRANQGRLTEEAAIRQILNAETAKHYFAGLRRILKRTRQRGGINMIKIPNPDSTTNDFISITDPTQIEKYLLERNLDHYAQAQGTPFTTELGSLIGLSGTSPFADSVLDGTVQLESLSPAVQAIFRQLEQYTPSPLPTTITTNDFSTALEKWKERTTTSPSGRHLGHYKCLTVKLCDGTDEIAENLLEMHTLMLNIAQNRMQPYKRWKKETEVMLEKDQGDPKIHRLRIICLYEADYNLFLKILWAHRLMKHAEYNKMFGEAQGGGRPHRTSNDIALRKMLTYTYARSTRTNFAFLDLDAKSCYDRIVAGFAMLCSRHYGMPSSACKLHGITIAQMQHHVKTALRVSQAFFESTPEKMIYGSGQGSSGSPPLWIVCSDILFKALESLTGKGMLFTNPSGTIKDTRTTDAFVDDATNGINDVGTYPLDERTIMHRLQIQAEAWEQLLYTSGGKLELPKCLVYLMLFEFPKGEPELRKKSSILSRINLRCSQTGEISQINQLDCKESHKTLGTYQNPCGDPSEQIKVLKQKDLIMSASFCQMGTKTIDQTPTPKWRVNLALNSFYYPTTQFALGTSLMNYKEADSTCKRCTRSIIGAFGVNRKFPRVIAFAPSISLGLDLKHPYFTQWSRHVIQLLQHVNQLDTNGKLYLMILENFQLVSGVTLPLLEFPDHKLPHLSDRFICGLRQFLSECNLKIKLELDTPQPQRENDRCVMLDILKIEKSPSALRQFNQVRLYLEVFWLSDITTIAGDAIEPLLLKSSTTVDRISFSNWTWPRQPNPPRKAWQIWKKLIRKQYMVNKQGRLGLTTTTIALGNFFGRHQRHRIWKWEFSPSQNIVIQSVKSNNTTLVLYHKPNYGHQGTRRTLILSIDPSELEVVESCPRDGCPIYHHSRNGNLHFFRRVLTVSTTQPASLPPKIRFSLTKEKTEICRNNCEGWEQPLFQHTGILNPIYNWRGHEHTLSIGIASASHGAIIVYSWVIRVGALPDPVIARGTAVLPPSNEHGTITQGNLYAIHTALYSLRSIISEDWDNYDTPIIVYSNDQPTCNQCNNLWKVNNHNPRWRTSRYYEISTYIQATLESTILFCIPPQADRPEGQEVIDEAFDWVLEHKNFGPGSPSLKKPANLCKASLFNYNTQITTNHSETIHACYSRKRVQSYLLKKHTWSSEDYNLVNWPAFEHTAKKLQISQRIKLMKFVYNWLPIGKRMIAIDPEASNECPSCGVYESHDHLLRCTNPAREALQINFLEDFKKCSKQNHMPILATNVLATYIEEWFSSGLNVLPLPNTPTIPTELRDSIADQNQIGWKHFLRGRIATSFQTIVNQTRDIPLSRYETNKWTISVIRLIWTYFSDTWDMRNKCLHGATVEETTILEREKLLQSAENLYNRRFELNPTDRQNHFPPWEQLTTKPTENLRIWLSTVRQLVNILVDASTLADDDPGNLDDNE